MTYRELLSKLRMLTRDQLEMEAIAYLEYESEHMPIQGVRVLNDRVIVSCEV